MAYATTASIDHWFGSLSRAPERFKFGWGESGGSRDFWLLIGGGEGESRHRCGVVVNPEHEQMLREHLLAKGAVEVEKCREA